MMPTLSSTATSADPAAAPARRPRLSVIVPARNCVPVLRACVQGLERSTLPRSDFELLIVDDCSTDDTPQQAAQWADRVLHTVNGPKGPGAARNVAARVASAPLLLFVDSDVVVSPDTLLGFVQAFEANPAVAAIFGAYDNAPAAPGVVSQYRNLLHHYVHSTNPGEATTFWAGCGGVRRDIFLAVGGFDGDRYPRPQIEDIELGQRLVANGYRVQLMPSLQGKHLKRWTFVNMVRTDLRERAIPWMRLVLEAGQATQNGPLNLQRMEKVRGVLTALGVPLLLVGLLLRDWRLAAVALLMLLIVLWGNAAMLAWFARQRGLAFALAVAPLRLVYYLVSVSGAGWAMLTHRSSPARPAPAPLTAEHSGVTTA
jgi:hypothetical protein